MRTTYPTALSSNPVPRQQSPRMFSPVRMRNKGKGRALPTFHPAPPAGEIVGHCRWNPALGYVCEVCSRIVPNPPLHRTQADGSGCVDFSGSGAPLAREVWEDVVRDPEGAVRRAEELRGIQGQRVSEGPWYGSQWASVGYHEGTLQQTWVGGQPALLARPGGSTAVPSFTRASQMQQWSSQPEHQQYRDQEQGRTSEGGGPGLMF